MGNCCQINKQNDLETQLDLISPQKKNIDNTFYSDDDTALPSTRAKDPIEYFNKSNSEMDSKNYDLPLKVENTSQDFIYGKNSRLTFDPMQASKRSIQEGNQVNACQEQKEPFNIIVDVQKVDTPKFNQNKIIQPLNQQKPSIIEELTEEQTENNISQLSIKDNLMDKHAQFSKQLMQDSMFQDSMINESAIEEITNRSSFDKKCDHFQEELFKIFNEVIDESQEFHENTQEKSQDLCDLNLSEIRVNEEISDPQLYQHEVVRNSSQIIEEEEDQSDFRIDERVSYQKKQQDSNKQKSIIFEQEQM